jgi:ferredoxin/transposase-like protein
MARLENRSADELRDLLRSVTGQRAVQQLMLALAYKGGASVPELAERYGIAEDRIDEWFAALEAENLGATVDGLERLSVADRARTPVGGNAEPSVVEYLAYDAARERGWAVDDVDLFEKAAAELQGDVDAFGRFRVEPDESIAAAADRAPVEWPDGCRGGACSNCAVYLYEGAVAMSGDHVLPAEVVEEEGIRLSCVGIPTSERVRLVYGVRHLDILDEYLLPSSGFQAAGAD